MESLFSKQIGRVHSTSKAVNVNNISDNNLYKDSNNDLFQRIKGLVYLGKALGIIPWEGIFKKQLSFGCFGHNRRSWKIGTPISLGISIILAINSVVSFIGMCQTDKKNAAELAWAAATFVFYSYGTFLYNYFSRQAEEFSQLFLKWSTLELHANLCDKSLSRDAGIITGLIFISAVMENLLLQIIEFPTFEPGMNNSTDSTLKTYYIRSHTYWANLVSYHWFWAIFVLFSNKFTIYAWNFVDILIAVLSRAVYAKFRLLYEDMEQRIEQKLTVSISEDLYEGSKNDGQMWISLVRDHSTLCNLLGEFERFLSPLIFCSYGINIYFTCLQLFLGLTPGRDPQKGSHVKSTLYTIYANWSFVHLIVRLYIVSISAAKVNVHAHLINRVLRSCPSDHYTTEVERIERKVNTGPEIGLSGLGCFIITKPFILSIIGVVFTFEIVLLQASPQPNS